MSSALLSLLDRDRPATVFLPPISFGIMYGRYDQLSICENIPSFIPTLGFPRWFFLLMALFSSIVAAVLFAMREEIAKSQSDSQYSAPPLVGLFSALDPIMLLISFSEVALRICNAEVLLVVIFLAHWVLMIMTVTEWLS